MTNRIQATAMTFAVTLGLVVASAATPADARPSMPDRPNGVTRSVAQRAATTAFGDCADAGVVCKPQNQSGPCNPSNNSQSTPPSSIRVYDPTYTGANHIRTVAFETYVENVLPNEWLNTWDGDALKAGAVAITSYAWYWATHYGGYVGTPSTNTCFDVTNDQNFQVYEYGSAQANSTSKVQQVFPSAIRVGGTVLQAGYFSAVRSGYNAAHPSTYDACGQSADGTFLSQSGSQTCNENSTGNKWPVILKIYYGASIQIASTRQLRTQHDFQYLHRSTRATFAAGRWSIDDGYPTTFSFGQSGDIPTVNTAGDGFARIGVFRPTGAIWYLGSPTGGVAKRFQFGLKGDIPVQAQYKGVTQPTQVAVFRPSTRTWYFAGPSGGTASTIGYGLKGDTPVPGRWLSASADSIAVFRPSTGTWYVRGGPTVQYGEKGDIPVPADYNGDGLTDIAVYRPSNRTFYVRGQASVHWGLAGDVPVTGDYTGDGRADLVVYRPSNHTWYVRGGSTTTFGATGATPIGAAPYRD